MSGESTIPDTLNATWKNDKSRFGYKMLQKMGWSEDKGLGKKEEGIVAAVKLKKREDGVGLGMERLTDGAGAKGWSETATSFSSVLDVLKQTYKKKESKKSKKEKRKREGNGEGGGDNAEHKEPPLRISVGMKYKKHSLAKSLSNKTDTELRAVLGAAATARPSQHAISSSGLSGSTSTNTRKRSGSTASLDGGAGGVQTRKRSGSTVSVASASSVGSATLSKKRGGGEAIVQSESKAPDDDEENGEEKRKARRREKKEKKAAKASN